MGSISGFVFNYFSYGINNGDWGGKALVQGLIGAGISAVGFGVGFAASAGSTAIGMSANAAALVGGTIGGMASGGLSSGINGGNVWQGMLTGGFGGFVGSAVGMSTVGEGFFKRGIASTFTGAITGGLSAGYMGGDIGQGMMNGAVGGAVGFLANEATKYMQQRRAETRAIQDELGLTKDEVRQLKRYGLRKINTKEFQDMNGELWKKLESLKLVDDSEFPYSLQKKDWDRNAIIKSGKIHLRYSTQEMIDNNAYRLNLNENGLEPRHYFNIHYDRFDVMMFPALHGLFDSLYQQWFQGVK